MKPRQQLALGLLASFVSLAVSLPLAAQAAEVLTAALKFEQQPNRLVITQGDSPVAAYVFRDREILRPYFASVHAPGGLPITRNHPPRAGLDAADHATMHPGIWLAFGDISGHDFWRNKDRALHVEFVEPPKVTQNGDGSILTFAVRNGYLASDMTICQELARHTIRASKRGFLFTFDSEFSAQQPFAFGDQEEMGLGIRLATEVTVKGGTGAITNSEGRQNEKEIWGQQADWCDYSGVITAKAEPVQKLRAGLLLVPHPQNFGRAWMHARDYGLVVANPFGRKAFTKAAASRVEIKPGEKLRLQYGVWSYAANSGDQVNHAALSAEYVRLSDSLVLP